MDLNNLSIEEQSKLPLNDFINLPSTVHFAVINGPEFFDYIKDKPYIKVGPELLTGYIIAYTNKIYYREIYRFFGYDFVHFYPFWLTTLSRESNDASGITEMQKLPFLDLKGQDVIIGFVDTGIDYTKNAFKFKDGTTKIDYIWDQTIQGNGIDDFNYGTVYTKEDINRALNSETPLSIVPSVDEIGHGTFLASVASANEDNDYIGAAPLSEIICVKLRKMNDFFTNIYEYLQVSEDITFKQQQGLIYSSLDVLLGIRFIVNKAFELKKPVVICVGVGGNFGYHNGKMLLEEYISAECQKKGVVIVTAAGNESQSNHHTEGKILKTNDVSTFNISTPNEQVFFNIFIWSQVYDKLSVSVKSPTGEIVPRSPLKIGTTTNKLIFENTYVSITYYVKEEDIIIVTILTETPGIWEISLYGDFIIEGNYDVWTQVNGIINPNIKIIQSVPTKTIVIPSTSIRSITCGAYDSLDDSLYSNSSWGPSNYPRYLPDFIAPGVNVKGIYPNGPGKMTGSSVAAAVTSGAAALLLQWGIVEKNDITMDCDKVKSYLISGCRREENVIYPNNQEGFGRLDLLGTFKFLKL